ncbi:MAG: zf-HC2 domain-containing protein [Bacillota bacterium]|nr:zf-HC2 domain-containing protein [Bacillota bacterium]MDW7684741.1 zf-HC2 domain-containing protein [Bacillota bacterium]
MNLDCAVVKDLYVLYKEDELSPEVKSALENHLQQCPDCCSVYESGSGFKDILHTMEEKEPSKKMDEKIMLKLKVRRLQFVVAIVLIIFAVTSVQSYYNARSHLQSDLAHLEQSLWTMHLGIGNVKHEAYSLSPTGMFLEAVNDRNHLIFRNLSNSERSHLRDNHRELFLHPRLGILLETLNRRYLAQTWTERDEAVQEQVTGYFLKAVELLTDERQSLNNLHGNKLRYIFHRINIGELADIYHDLNSLALTYTSYDMLPTQITPLTEEELTARLQILFPGAEMINISGIEKVSIWGEVTFDLETDAEQYYGRLDAFTGNLLEADSRAQSSGELLPVESVETNLNEFLPKLLGRDYTYQTEYLGINYNFSSSANIKLHTWRVYPVFDEYRYDHAMVLRFDARTGNLYMFHTERGPLPKIEPDPTIEILIDQEEALVGADLPAGTPTNLSYTETVLIHSRLTGKIQPAHVYHADSDQRFYINAVLGKRDTPQ